MLSLIHISSEREGEMLALQFVAAGFHAAILWYSVKPATFPTALLELSLIHIFNMWSSLEQDRSVLWQPVG